MTQAIERYLDRSVRACFRQRVAVEVAFEVAFDSETFTGTSRKELHCLR